MKQLIKNVLTVCFAAAAVLGTSFAAEPAFAADETSQWALEAGGDLLLANDIILSSDIKIEKSINIDLNGHQIISIGKALRKSEYNGGDELTHSVFGIEIAHGAEVSIKNGTLIDVPIYNRGSDLRLEALSICNPHCGGITNRGEIYKIDRCEIYAQSGAVNSSGRLRYLENSRISADRYEAVQGKLEKISRCYISCEDSARGVALSDGNPGNIIKLVEDCLLVGNGRGGISSWGGIENVRGCTVIGLGKSGDSSRGCAMWMALDKERAKPYIANCTLIAEDPGCGYYQGASSKSGFIESANYSADCRFIKLSEIENIDEFLKWRPGGNNEPLFGAPAPGEKLKNSFLNYRIKNEYGAAGFTDIDGVSWAHPNIKKAYETGLMLGTGDSEFSPRGGLSYAEAVVLAARLHSIFTGSGDGFEQTDIWFETYFSYAKKHGIVPAGGASEPLSGGSAMTREEYENCLKPVSRADFAAVLASALPDCALRAVNLVADASIPDVKAAAGDDKTAPFVYKLYRAGVIAGSAKDRRFDPELPISRAEAACIITRMADPSLRIRFTID